MNGNLARCTGCWGTTRVDFGSYSSMVIVWASARPHDRNAAKENLMGLGNILQEGISDFRCWISDLRLRLPEAAAGFEIRNPKSDIFLFAPARTKPHAESLLAAAHRLGIFEKQRAARHL